MNRLEVQYNGLAFPAGTRYMTETLETVILGEEQEIVLPMSGAVKQMLWLNVNHTLQKNKASQLVLNVTALGKNDNLLSFDQVTLSADAVPLSFELNGILPAIRKNGTLTIPSELQTHDLVWQVEHLVRNEEGKLEYITDEQNFGLDIRFYQQLPESETRALTISNSEGKAPLGSYRLVIKRQYEGVDIAETSVAFFIHQ